MLSDKEYAELKELLNDAKWCARLTPFESSFVSSVQAKVEEYGRRVLISERQQMVLEQIQQRVYAV